MNPIELTITIKDEDRKLTKKELLYEPLLLVMSNPVLVEKVEEIVKEFGGDSAHDAPAIKITCSMVWQ